MQRQAIGRNRDGHARLAEPRDDVPERLVHGRVRAEREQERHEHAEPEHDREPAFAPREEHEPRDRGERNEPAEEDERLEAVPRVPRDEVEQLGRVALDLRERAARRAGRAADLRDPDEHAGSSARRRTDCADERLPAHDGVGEEEEDRPEREVHLPGQRHGGDRGDREPAAPSLERPEREREQHRDRPEQVSAGGLDRTVRGEREREPADERSAERESQRTQPGGGRRTRTEVGQERERVPRADGPEERVQRPEDDRERPAGVVRPLRRLGLEAVGVEPRRMPAAELMPGEPEVVRRLQVVAGRHDVRARLPVREQLVRRVAQGRRERERPGREIQRAGEGYSARAAASGTSKSGTSPVS